MIDASMYTINNFSPADFIGGAPDAAPPIGGLSDPGGPYGREIAPGRSFREYLASLTSAAETYANRRENEGPAVHSGSYGRSAGDQAEYSTQSAAQTESAEERVSEQDPPQHTDSSSAESAASEENLRTDENRTADESGEMNGRTEKKEDGAQTAGTGDPDGPKAADMKQSAADQNSAVDGHSRETGETDAVDQENRHTAGKIRQERSARIRRREEDAAAALSETERAEGRAEQAAAADQAMKAGIASADRAVEQNVRRMKEKSEGDGQKGEGKAPDSRRMNSSGAQRLGDGNGRDTDQQRPRITIVDSRRKTGRTDGKTAEASAERFFERTGRSGNRAGSAGRTESPEFRLISSQSNASVPGSQADQTTSQQQVFQVLLRSEGNEHIQVPLSKSENSADLQNQLTQQLREQLNSEIVKRGSIMVRNNGSGEIRLELKPDHLGQVKIHLSLENNNIAGRILVENINVKEAFDQNMQELYRVFKEHGFGETALNVSVGNQRRQKNAPKDANGSAGGASGITSLQAIEAEQSRTLQSTGEQRLVDVLA